MVFAQYLWLLNTAWHERKKWWDIASHLKVKNKTEILSTLGIVSRKKEAYPLLPTLKSIYTSLSNYLWRFSNTKTSAKRRVKNPVGHGWMTSLFLWLPTMKWENSLLFWEWELQRNLVKHVVWNLGFQQSKKHFHQIWRHGLMKIFGSQSLLIALGLCQRS